VRKRPARASGREIQLVHCGTERAHVYAATAESLSRRSELEGAKVLRSGPVADVLFATDLFQKVPHTLLTSRRRTTAKCGSDRLVRRSRHGNPSCTQLCVEKNTSERRAMSTRGGAPGEGRILMAAKINRLCSSQLADATLVRLRASYPRRSVCRNGNKRQETTISVLSTSVFSHRATASLGARHLGTHNALHLWVIMNESCQGRRVIRPGLKSSLDAFPFGALCVSRAWAFCGRAVRHATPRSTSSRRLCTPCPATMEMRRSSRPRGLHWWRYVRPRVRCLRTPTSLRHHERDVERAHAAGLSGCVSASGRTCSWRKQVLIFEHTQQTHFPALSPKKLFLFNAFSATSAAVPAVTSTVLGALAAPSQPAY